MARNSSSLAAQASQPATWRWTRSRAIGPSALSISGDSDRKAAQRAVKEEGITWQSFWDAEVYGPIATRWDVEVWPTLFLIDHKGVVRHVFVGWPEAKKLDALIDGLVSEAR